MFTHTPTPYFLIEHSDRWTIQTRPDGAGLCVAQQYADSDLATGAFIVRACNSHDDLLAAAIEASRLLSGSLNYEEGDEETVAAVEALNKAIDKARLK